jgi:hypothetical protein
MLAAQNPLDLRIDLVRAGDVYASMPSSKEPQDWTCPAIVPLRLLIYAAFRSKAKGLFQPSAECFLRAL